MRAIDARHYILSAEVVWDKVPDPSVYPFSLPALRGFDRLELHPKVTFLVGENGSGKSTLIEAIAIAAGFNAEGGSRNFNFVTRASHSDLYKAIRLARGARRPKDGFFLRAESYFTAISYIEEIDREPAPSPPIMPAFSDRSLHEQSHGESFFALMENRLHGNGFYVMDEPEAALSPNRQLSMLARMKQLIDKNSQFLIATHSPILMAYPDAWIYQIGSRGIERVAYEDTEHFEVTRSFLNRREVFLDILMADDD